MGKALRSVTNATGLTTAKVPGVGNISLNKAPFDIEAEKNRTSNQIQQLRQNAGAQVQQNQTGQSAVTAQMAQAAQGKGPSIAAEQMKQAQERSLAQQIAASQTGRGGAGTQRRLSQNLASSGQNIARDAGLARMQEQQNAQKMFLDQARGQESNYNDLIKQQFEVDTSAKRTMQDFERARSGAAATQSSLMNSNSQQATSAMGGFISSATAAATMPKSDKNSKKNIKPADDKVDSFLSALKASKYEYKDASKPGTAKGDRFGIMAQDLEKSEMGKSLVVDTPNGKMIDTNQSIGAVLAAQSRLNDRLNTLEKKKKKV